MRPRFPIYIPSKGRYESRLTMKCLDSMGVPYRVVVEEQELEQYAAVIDRSRLLVLDPAYQRAYDTCDQYGLTKSPGSGPARNFIWDHAQAEGHSHHWVMDDNIRQFLRLNRNHYIRVGDGTVLRCMEDFVLRYLNVAMAGPQYFMFAPRKLKMPAFVANTRVFSCNLIRTDLPYRWRCRYNEDADLSIRMLKDGWCTILFNAFLQEKMATQLMKGGNTDALYKPNGTLPKSRMLARLHPDVARVSWKFNRWHHHVDFRPFRKNKLVLRPGVVIPDADPYGLHVVQIREPKIKKGVVFHG